MGSSALPRLGRGAVLPAGSFASGGTATRCVPPGRFAVGSIGVLGLEPWGRELTDFESAGGGVAAAAPWDCHGATGVPGFEPAGEGVTAAAGGVPGFESAGGGVAAAGATAGAVGVPGFEPAGEGVTAAAGGVPGFESAGGGVAAAGATAGAVGVPGFEPAGEGVTAATGGVPGFESAGGGVAAAGAAAGAVGVPGFEPGGEGVAAVGGVAAAAGPSTLPFVLLTTSSAAGSDSKPSCGGVGGLSVMTVGHCVRVCGGPSQQVAS